MRPFEITEYDPSFVPHSFQLADDFSFATLSSLETLRPNSITFLKNKKFLNHFLESYKTQKIHQVYLLIEQELFNSIESRSEFNILADVFSGIGTVKSVDLAMGLLSRPFYLRKHRNRNEMVDGRQMGTAQVHPSAQIAQNVFIGENVEIAEEVTIYPGAVVMGNCRVGARTTLYPNVSLNHDVVIGADCRVHSNTVLGSDGFGYHFNQGTHVKVWHLGGVVVEDHVELGANCTIDRGTFKDTIIGSGSKLDNAVHVAHNCVLGKGIILCAQSALAGSAQVGDYTMFGGRAAVASNIQMGAGCMVAAGAMVKDSWPANSKLGGYPAIPHQDWLRSVIAIKRLVQK